LIANAYDAVPARYQDKERKKKAKKPKDEAKDGKKKKKSRKGGEDDMFTDGEEGLLL